MRITLQFLSILTLLTSCNKDESTTTPEVIFKGEVDLITQQDVDDFGSQGYTRITGNLNIGADIGPISTIENLDGLTKIQSVESNVRIRNNPKLENIDGLNNLKSIEWSLLIHNNDLLSNIAGLSGLTFVRNDVAIYENRELLSLNGLQNWNSKTTGLDITIVANPKLSDLCALKSILSVVGPAEFDASGNSFNPTKEQILIGQCSQ